MGEGGALNDASVRLELLVEDYKESACLLSAKGFNGGVLDLEPCHVCDSVAIPDNKEAHIQILLKINAFNKAGSLFKSGVHVCNSNILLEAVKRNKELDRLVREKNSLGDRYSKYKEALKAVEIHLKWIAGGKKVDANGYPVLSTAGSKLVLNILLPRIDPAGKKSKCVNKADCVKWLGNLSGEKTWDNEMLQVEQCTSAATYEASL